MTEVIRVIDGEGGSAILSKTRPTWDVGEIFSYYAQLLLQLVAVKVKEF